MNFFETGQEQHSAKRHTVILPLDTLVMVSVVMVLLLVITFSLGVEKGRRIAYPSLERIIAKEANVGQANNKAEADNVDTTGVMLPQPSEIESSPSGIFNQPVVDEEIQNRYLIQVASFMKEKIARQEAKTLEDDGYPVEIAKKGKFVVIFVGDFSDRQQAQKNMETLKKRYKDCFIRRL